MAVLVLPRGVATSQPPGVGLLTPKFAPWEFVYSGSTGARNLGAKSGVGSFAGASGLRRYEAAGVGYQVGEAPYSGGVAQSGLSIGTLTTSENHSGVIVFDLGRISVERALFDAGAGGPQGFYVKTRTDNCAEIDSRGAALMLLSVISLRAGVNTVVWGRSAGMLAVSVNGALEQAVDNRAYQWAEGNFGATTATGGAETQIHGQYLSAFTRTVALTPQEVQALGANPWQMFQAPARRLWVSGAAVQLLRPSSDITAGTWTPSSGTSLFATINEAVASDATYDLTSQASTFEVGITAGTAPGVTTGHVVRYRVLGAVTVSLRQGTTTIASWAQSPAAMTTYAQTLTSLQAAAITNYAALKLQFQAT